MEKEDESGQYLQRKWGGSYRCPSCDITLKSGEMKTHCELEVNRLVEPRTSELNDILITNDESHTTVTDIKSCPWGIFQKVQKNRQSRSEIRSRKRSPTDTKCPICSTQVTRDINSHIEKCLKSNNVRIDTINEENAYRNMEVYEEYEWAGQKRIRVSSLLQGGYASIGIGTNANNKENEEDEDLNVDEDDTKMYGPPQYNESDVIAPDYLKNEHAKECYINNYLRQLITENVNSKKCSTPQEEKEDSTVEAKNGENYEQEKIEYLAQIGSKSAQQIIDSLKSKLRQWESHTQNKFKCLICLDEYHNPAISVSCWHVHCEECWLRSLGARKLCPQCNLITSPSDLRRIYM